VSGRILSLDGWRGLAIIAVLIGHFAPPPGVNFGTLGVELFFVLSGRLMADILFVHRLALPEFFYRRVTRIVPALAFFVVAFWIAAEIAGDPYALSPMWIAAALTFTINYVSLLAHPTGWFDHLWSLCVEEHAYLLLGLIAFLFGRSTGRPVVVISVLGLVAMIIGVVSMTLFEMSYFETYWRSDVHIASIFLAGAIYLGLRQAMDQARVRRWATPVFLAAAAAGVVLSLETMPTPVTYTAGTLCFCVAVALCDVVARPITAALSTPALTQIGLWSYSLYLWQQPFYKLHERFPDHGALLFVAAIGAGLASYYFVERPARRWLNALWGRFGKKAPVSA
jgi:peptidoglycan/LPS O-acetylase OafA/YrhL